MTTAVEWEQEAKRLYRRYVEEFVEGFGLCPWAASARVRGTTYEAVWLAEDANAHALADELETLSQMSSSREVVFLIMPRLRSDYRGFVRLFSAARDDYFARYERGMSPYLLAAFHPDGPLNTDNENALVSFIRRTPDPVVQMLATESLQALKAEREGGTQFFDPDAGWESVTHAVFAAAAGKVHATGAVRQGLSEHVARRNLATMNSVGIERMQAVVNSIRQDRETTYARLRDGGTREQ